MHSFIFIALQHAMYAERDTVSANLSVRPSVRPSHSKRNECTHRQTLSLSDGAITLVF